MALPPPFKRQGLLGGGIDSRVGSAIGFDIMIVPAPALLVRDFATLGADVRSFRVPLKRAIKEVLIPSFKENFRVSGRPIWEPLDRATQERKLAEKSRYLKPLMRTGLLSRVAGQLNIWTITRDTAVVEDLPEKVKYGRIHQGGIGDIRSVASNVTPARPFLVIQEQDMNDIEEIFFDWIEMRVRDRGFRSAAL